LTSARISILKPLVYYNIFNYPLTKEEIISFFDAEYSVDEIKEAFRYLEAHKLIYFLDGFYSLYSNHFIVQRRKMGNEKAIKQLRIADKVGGFLSRFPFVKGVAVSGSLSKLYADENSDIDFFIITATDRLWLARTFLHLFKKLTFLVGKQHWFCMNYFVDEAGLEIKEKNIYTAMEVVTAMPMRDKDVFSHFIVANGWVKEYFYKKTTDISEAKKIRSGIVKAFWEMFFNNRFGDWVNTILMKITIKRWNRKTANKMKNKRGILLGMDAGLHYSKPDPRYFQEKIVHQFEMEMEQWMQRLEVTPAVRAV
jgi:predicted nucleotidyltransferase